jgi:hypothetical protein
MTISRAPSGEHKARSSLKPIAAWTINLHLVDRCTGLANNLNIVNVGFAS